MNSHSANLQPASLTVKQAAAAANVSERTVYMALKILRSGRTDLIGACERGEMSLHKALKIIDRVPDKTALDPLVITWRNASAADRRIFLDWLADEAEAAA
jgi:hypothetical protein